MAVVQHRSGGTDVDRDAQSQLLRLHFQSTQAWPFFRQTHRGNDSGRAAGTFLVHLTMPIPQLLLKIFLIVKSAYLKKGRLYETHQVLDTAFLLGTIRPAQLHADAHLQRGVSEDRIPFRHLAVSPPLQSNRLWSIKHA